LCARAVSWLVIGSISSISFFYTSSTHLLMHFAKAGPTCRCVTLWIVHCGVTAAALVVFSSVFSFSSWVWKDGSCACLCFFSCLANFTCLGLVNHCYCLDVVPAHHSAGLLQLARQTGTTGVALLDIFCLFSLAVKLPLTAVLLQSWHSVFSVHPMAQ
jgi:hypothetical protein